MCEIALVTAVICIVGPFTIPIPISPVPLSLSIFAIYIGIYALNWWMSTISVILYILLGLIGLPVFSNGGSGLAKLAGPTGGYIIGYIFITLIAGALIDKFEKKYYMHIIGMVLGVIVCYAFGTAWFVLTMEGYTVQKALSVCVYPYIPLDIVKMVLGVLVGPTIRKAVRQINRQYPDNNNVNNN